MLFNFLRQLLPTQPAQEPLAECEKSFADIADTLENMRLVRSHRIVPYRTYAADAPLGADYAFLDIETETSRPPP